MSDSTNQPVNPSTNQPRKTRKPRSKLGRGLSALVDQTTTSPIQVHTDPIGSAIEPVQNANKKTSGVGSSTIGVEHGQVVELDVTRIRSNPHQPRRVFSPESLEELAESIAEHGLMQPIIVRLRQDGGGHELIAGERRWRASCHAGKTSIRAIVLDVDELKSAQLALIENIQREDLNAIERANGFAALAKGFGMTQEQIATKMGIARATVANILRLIELDEEIQQMIGSGVLSAGHGKALLACADLDRRLALARQAAQEHWNVRLLEKATMAKTGGNTSLDKGLIDQREGQVSRFESVLLDLETRLGEKLSTKVKLKTDQSGTKGSIQIEFYDLDHFDGLMHRLGIQDANELTSH